ncbi:MAG TPA: universal stress protein [Solirubrobacterales bacterium]|jgi:nucleotide-binding universal stress UspA family protein|nr:universal stress protein [Solirubrobacterales bacterium]
MASAAPVLIAFDGSGAARRAVGAAAELFGSRPVLVITVWEPDLAYAAAAMPTAGMEMQPTPFDIGEAHELEQSFEAEARRTAEDGAELARSAGVDAEALAVVGGAHPADAIVEVAGERRVAAIVVGSRGLSGLRARLEGSTSSRVVREAPCPVLIVHD